MSSTNPPGTQYQQLPPGVPPQEPLWQRAGPMPQGRGVSFFVAIFLGLLLLVSAALNVLLLLLSLGSFAGSLGETVDVDGGQYDLVRVAGDAQAQARVLRIPIQGAIAEGQNPLIGAGGGSVSQVRRALRLARSDDTIKAVVLAIDSPGGGVTDSDEIYKMLVDFHKDAHKPIVALFGDVAASGGYYVACAAEHIIARRSTITGSIGVIMSAWNFTEAAKKLGVDEIAIKSARTPFKDILSPTRPMADAEREMLTGIVDELYDQFVSVVSEGRSLDRDDVVAAATGAIYTAKQALERRLIDEIGDAESVERWLDRKGVGDHQIVELRRRASLRDLLLGARAPNPDLSALAAQFLQSAAGTRFLYYWQGPR